MKHVFNVIGFLSLVILSPFLVAIAMVIWSTDKLGYELGYDEEP